MDLLGLANDTSPDELSLTTIPDLQKLVVNWVVIISFRWVHGHVLLDHILILFLKRLYTALRDISFFLVRNIDLRQSDGLTF